MKRPFIVSAIVMAAMCWLLGADTGGPPSADSNLATEEAAIRKAISAYIATFNRGDARALAALWSPEAVYTNPLSGDQAVGQAAIGKQFATIFEKSKGARLDATSQSIQFVSPNVAIEQGTAKIIRPDEAPEETEYTAVYVKREGQWLLDRVTERDAPVVLSNYDHLKELEWMIGNWVDQDDQSSIQLECQWTKNRNFMTRSFAVSIQDRIELSGMQFVGWDPTEKRIRSWIFDSDGGFGEGNWSKKENRWYLQSTSTLPDGQKASSMNIITRIDDNTLTWQSIDRVVGGEILPNVDETVMVRQTNDK